jgi:uncharacterized 2Fe-2S/4Fe-4S cluster protein (DUF4445 family)
MERRQHRIVLQPLNVTLEAACGTPLRELLFEHGVEFPCGGRGRCRGCKVLVRKGLSAPNAPQREQLTEKELEAGWRLACQCSVEGDMELELRQWDAAVLVDETPFSFSPRPGLGVAVDLGTTTLVAQLLDLRSGRVLAVRTALNGQARYGADVMSRVQFAVNEGGARKLTESIREQIGKLIGQLLSAVTGPAGPVTDVVLCGNSVMHHLFCALNLEPLSRYPFAPTQIDMQIFPAAELGWDFPGNPVVRFLPCIGGFVGSDTLAGILATRLAESPELAGLVDLGTNGEIVLGNRDGMLCASTAAGPAFEGAGISQGMRAATGAIHEVKLVEGCLTCGVFGNDRARGICGSGLVDAVAVGLDMGKIADSGRFANGTAEWALAEGVALTQRDIRELQLAKGAIAAGIRLLLARLGAKAEDLSRLYLAGAFGNYINRESARRIGLFRLPVEKVQAAGNTALLGTKLALFGLGSENGDFAEIRSRITHVPLNADPGFQDAYVEEMVF